MEFVAPQKYVDLLDDALEGKKIDKDRIEQAQKEYDKILEETAQRSSTWEIDQTTAEGELSGFVARTTSEARKAHKSKLTPLGVQGTETKEGQ